jgi:hypothetical protein
MKNVPRYEKCAQGIQLLHKGMKCFFRYETRVFFKNSGFSYLYGSISYLFGYEKNRCFSLMWLQKPSILRACVREEDAGGREACAHSTTPTYTVRRDGPAREPSWSAFWLQRPSILRACVLVLVLVLHSYAVKVSSTGAKNQFQGDDNGHVGRPCQVSPALPFPELL